MRIFKKHPNAKPKTDNNPDQSMSQSLVDTPGSKDTTGSKRVLQKTWFRILAVILVIGVLATGWMFYDNSRNDAQAAARKMISAIIKNDNEAAYQLTSTAFRQNTTKEQLRVSISQISPYLTNATYEVVDHYTWVNNGQINSASLVYKISANNKIYYLRLLLDKNSNSDWKVSVFRISENPLAAQEN